MVNMVEAAIDFHEKFQRELRVVEAEYSYYKSSGRPTTFPPTLS